MTGESVAWREPLLPQPGSREPAPGELALVQSFINSHYDLEFEHGADLFVTPDALTRWLERRGLTGRSALTDRDTARAVAVREGLRALAGGGGELAGLNEAARGVVIELRLGADGPRFVPGAGGGLDRALAIVLSIAARAMIDGTWSRLKICPGDDCGWAFYDHSRNQSGRWCSMAVCGGRAKARAHYRRRRDEGW
ncbi:MAG TPA: CGNR zinc finger domain-containing protein [Solirubrobacteraceae bacterium]|nr:CGNR zinc finger domain-containing protein [Solirubrobacteraceae bacterium]